MALLVLLTSAAVLGTSIGAPEGNAVGPTPVVVGATTGGNHQWGIGCGYPSNQTCSVTFVNESVAAVHQAPGGATAPSAGVITSWAFAHSGLMPESGPVTASLLTVALRVVRGAGALDPGRYTFQVRATTPTGEADQTPAKVKFKVVPKKG